jgi:alcohol dehydrogenase class IV
MAYAVAGLVRTFRPRDYPSGAPLVPHGMSVILNAPAVFRHTAAADPQRHRDAARDLGARVDAAGDAEIGEALAAHIAELMRQTGMPPDLAAVGYGTGDIEPLVAGTLAQARLLNNAPCPVDGDVLRGLFADALFAGPALAAGR